MSEKKTIEAGFKEEIEKCQSRISFLDKNIEIHKNMLHSWTNMEGKLVRVTKSDLSQYLSGKSVPGNWKADILGKVLDVSPVWLMGFDVPGERSPETNKEPVIADELSATKQELLDVVSDLSETEAAVLLASLKSALGKL